MKRLVSVCCDPHSQRLWHSQESRIWLKQDRTLFFSRVVFQAYADQGWHVGFIISRTQVSTLFLCQPQVVPIHNFFSPHHIPANPKRIQRMGKTHSDPLRAHSGICRHPTSFLLSQDFVIWPFLQRELGILGRFVSS